MFGMFCPEHGKCYLNAVSIKLNILSSTDSVPNQSSFREESYIGPVKQIFKSKIAVIFLPIDLNICFGCKRTVSLRHSQHMFWLRNKKKISITHSNLEA